MQGKKILVVDDESRMRKLVHDYLSREGYEVFEAGDGEEGLKVFYEQKDLALVILDVMMPKLDGWEVLKEIRESSQIPVIMLTAKGDEDDELHGYSLGKRPASALTRPPMRSLWTGRWWTSRSRSSTSFPTS